jgi:hypothetical protein
MADHLRGKRQKLLFRRSAGQAFTLDRYPHLGHAYAINPGSPAIGRILTGPGVCGAARPGPG